MVSKRVKAGRTATFTCSIFEGDTVSFAWSKDGSILKIGSNIHILNSPTSSMLALQSTEPSDRGTYTCIGSNSMSEDRVTATLEIEGELITTININFFAYCFAIWTIHSPLPLLKLDPILNLFEECLGFPRIFSFTINLSSLTP